MSGSVEGAASTTGTKRQRGPDVEARRAQTLAQFTDPFQRMMIEGMYKQEDVGDDIRETVEATKSDIKRMDGVLAEHTTRMDETDKRMDELEKTLKTLQNGSAISTFSAGSGPPDGGGGGSGGRTQFSPTYIEIKGWVTDWANHQNRCAQMLTFDDAMILLNNISKVIAPDDQAFLSKEGTERINSGRYMFGSCRIKFLPMTDREVLYRTMKLLKIIVTPTAQRAPLPEGTTIPDPNVLIAGMAQVIDPTLLRFNIESAPWKRDHVRAVGRFCGAWRNVCQRHNLVLEVRGEVGPPKSNMWVKAQGDRLLRPICIAEFGAGQTWTIHETQWGQLQAKFPTLTITAPAFEIEVNRRV